MAYENDSSVHKLTISWMISRIYIYFGTKLGIDDLWPTTSASMIWNMNLTVGIWLMDEVGCGPKIFLLPTAQKLSVNFNSLCQKNGKIFFTKLE